MSISGGGGRGSVAALLTSRTVRGPGARSGGLLGVILGACFFP